MEFIPDDVSGIIGLPWITRQIRGLGHERSLVDQAAQNMF
jgi:hypothetical protein